MPATYHRPLPSLGAALLLLLAVSGCDGKPAAQPQQHQAPPPEVGVVTVAPQAITMTAELPGRTTGYRTADVRPQVSGIIQKRLFVEGTDVKEGQQLYQIDPAPYQASLDSAKASLAQAQANLQTAKLKAARYADLVTVNAVSKQDADDAQATMKADEAAVASAKASVETAAINLRYTKMYAPISGRIGKSSVTEGALVTSDQTTALATIQQLDPIYVDVSESSADLFRQKRDIAAGKLKGADETQAPVTLYLDDVGQPYDIPGKLLFSEVSVDETTGMVKLRAQFPNPKHILLPGLFVRARLDQGIRENTIVIPQQAVIRQPDGSTTVWVVSADNKVESRPVQATHAIGDKWVIDSGLAAGERVIVEGTQKVHPGIPVKPVPAGSSGQAGAGTPPAASDHKTP